jgi:hypothetical protein
MSPGALSDAAIVRLEIAAVLEMNPTKSDGAILDAMYWDPSARVTVNLAGRVLKLLSVPWMFAPTDITPGANVNVAATGLFVEKYPDWQKRPPVAAADQLMPPVLPVSGEAYQPLYALKVSVATVEPEATTSCCHNEKLE